MLREEIFQTLRQTALTLSFSILLPVIYFINEARLPENKPFGHYVEFGIMMLIVFLVISLAYTIFAREDRDKAAEYLKSLPISRLNLLWMKILPRLLVSLFFLFGYVFFVSPLAGRFTIAEYTVVLVPALVLMFSGFLLGISDRKNPVLAGLLLLPAVYWMMLGSISSFYLGKYLLSHTEFLYRWTGNSVVQMRICILLSVSIAHLLPTVLPVAVLLPIYKNWDCASGKIRSQKMLKRLLFPTGLIIGITVVTFSQF